MKIGVIQHPPVQHRWRYLLQAQQSFREFSVEFGSENPDVLLVDQQSVTPETLPQSLPVIVLARQDASAIYHPPSIALAHLPNVRAIFQNHLVTPPHLSNQTSERYHYLIIARAEGLESPPPRPMPIPEWVLEKFHQVHWDSESSFLRFLSFGLFSLGPLTASRRIDIHCCLNGDPHLARDVYVDKHREAAVRGLAKCSNMSMFVKRPADPGVPWEQYIGAMLQSKIVVSPWGFGEYCHRDVEALLCGCVLIKPDTSFVATTADLFSLPNSYVRCKADFSDLPEQIARVRECWSASQDLREANRELFTMHPFLDVRNFALYFINKVRAVLEMPLLS